MNILGKHRIYCIKILGKEEIVIPLYSKLSYYQIWKECLKEKYTIKCKHGSQSHPVVLPYS